MDYTTNQSPLLGFVRPHKPRGKGQGQGQGRAYFFQFDHGKSVEIPLVGSRTMMNTDLDCGNVHHKRNLDLMRLVHNVNPGETIIMSDITNVFFWLIAIISHLKSSQ